MIVICLALLVLTPAQGPGLEGRIRAAASVKIEFMTPDGRVELKNPPLIRQAADIVGDAGLVQLTSALETRYLAGSFQWPEEDMLHRWYEVNGFPVKTGAWPCCGTLTVSFLDDKGDAILSLAGSDHESRPSIELLMRTNLPRGPEGSCWPTVELPRDAWRRLEGRFGRMMPGEGSGEGLAKKVRLDLGEVKLAALLKQLHAKTGAAVACDDGVDPLQITVSGDTAVPEAAGEFLARVCDKAGLTVEVAEGRARIGWQENGRQRAAIEHGLAAKRGPAAEATLALMRKIGVRGVDGEAVGLGLRAEEIIVTAKLAAFHTYPSSRRAMTDVFIGMRVAAVHREAGSWGGFSWDENPLLHYAVRDSDLAKVLGMVNAAEGLDLVIVGNETNHDAKGQVISGSLYFGSGGVKEPEFAPRWYPLEALPCFQDLIRIEEAGE